MYKKVSQPWFLLFSVTQYLDIHVVINNTAQDEDYPVNLLRNVAMNFSIYQWCFIVDADALPGSDQFGFVKDLESAIVYNMRDKPNTFYLHKTIFIGLWDLDYLLLVPALELTAKVNLTQLLNSEMPPKNEVVKMMRKNELRPMHPSFKSAYYPTNYPIWAKSKTPFDIPYLYQFEPVRVAYCDSLSF